MRMPNLLIVDGSDEFRAALSQALQNHFRIHCCKTGKEALEYALRQHPDVMVLDLMLPGLDGFSLLTSLRDAHICPIVLATTRLLSDYIVQRTRFPRSLNQIPERSFPTHFWIWGSPPS